MISNWEIGDLIHCTLEPVPEHLKGTLWVCSESEVLQAINEQGKLCPYLDPNHFINVGFL